MNIEVKVVSVQKELDDDDLVAEFILDNAS